jgi:hypothetical protein
MKQTLLEEWRKLKKECLAKTASDWHVYQLSTEDGHFLYRYLSAEEATCVLSESVFDVFYDKDGRATKKELVSIKQMTQTRCTFFMYLEFKVKRLASKFTKKHFLRFCRLCFLVLLVNTCFLLRDVPFSTLTCRQIFKTFVSASNLDGSVIALCKILLLIFLCSVIRWLHFVLEDYRDYAIPPYYERRMLIKRGSAFVKKEQGLFLVEEWEHLKTPSIGIARRADNPKKE